MKAPRLLLDFFIREWLLIAAAVGLVITSVQLGRAPLYTANEITPIFLLLALFVAVKGIENSGFLVRVGLRLERGGFLPVKLVVITFVLSMVVTIDVSLVTMIPLVLSLNIRQRDRLVILVALTAHVGAALMPFGTPQNLFIFSFYRVDPLGFIREIAPFSFGMLLVFLLTALFTRTTRVTGTPEDSVAVGVRRAGLHGLLLLLVVLCVLRVLHPAFALLAIIYPLLFDRDSLRVDYALLATFLCFIGLAGNIGELISAELRHPHHVFLLSAVLSQFISNVPTTLLLTPFTEEWKALLWGTNVGGFGSLVAAMANLITYKLYAAHRNGNRTAAFTLKFILAGYVAFFIGLGLFFGLKSIGC